MFVVELAARKLVFLKVLWCDAAASLFAKDVSDDVDVFAFPVVSVSVKDEEVSGDSSSVEAECRDVDEDFFVGFFDNGIEEVGDVGAARSWVECDWVFVGEEPFWTVWEELVCVEIVHSIFQWDEVGWCCLFEFFGVAVAECCGSAQDF